LEPQRDSIINLETASTASTVSARDLSENVHHDFLDFLVKNPELLRSVTNSVDGMIKIQKAFEEDCRRRGSIPPVAEIKKLFQRFKPTIGSAVGRRERDTKKIRKTKVYCPFHFCGNPFTRSSGLKSEDCYFITLTNPPVLT
jgi:hypothetical protein